MAQAANSNQDTAFSPLSDAELYDMHKLLKTMFNGAVIDQRATASIVIQQNTSCEFASAISLAKGTVAQTAMALLATEAEIRARQERKIKL